MGNCVKIIVLLGVAVLISNQAAGENLLPGDTSFETESSSLASRCWGGLKPERSDEAAFDGTTSLKCSAKGSFSSEAIELTPGKSYTFSMYAKAVEKPVEAHLYVANPAWKHTVRSKTFTLTPGQWSRHSLTFKAQERLYFAGFSPSAPGTMTDAWQLEEGEAPGKYASPSPISLGVDIDSKNQNTFFPDDTATIKVDAYKAWTDLKSMDIKLQLKIHDHLGEEVLSETRPLSFAETACVVERWAFAPGKLGWFEVHATVLVNGEKVAAAPTASLVFVARPEATAAGLKPFCGLSGTRSCFPALKMIGVKWVELAVHWNKTEKERGVYDWSGLAMLEERKRDGYWNKVTIAHFPSAPEWAWNEEEAKSAQVKELKEKNKLRFGLFPAPDKLADWKKMVANMAREFAPYIDLYEIGGEDDLTAGKNEYYLGIAPAPLAGNYFAVSPFLNIYAAMISAAAEEIKKQQPNALIGAIRPSGVDSTAFNYTFPFSTPVFKKCGKSFNLFPLDSYCCPRYISSRLPKASIPEYILANTFKKAVELGETYGNGQQVYISELGYGIDYRDVEHLGVLNEQLNRLSRVFLFSRATPKVLFCNWFSQVSLETATGENEFYQYGLWWGSSNPRPLPAVAAYSAVAGIVENVTEASVVDLHSQVKVAVFAKADGAATAGVWMPEGKGMMTLSDQQAKLQVLDVMGNPIPLKSAGGKFAVSIGEAPIYFKLPAPSFWSDWGDWLTFRPSGNSFKNLEDALSKAAISLPWVAMEIQEINGETVDLLLKNMTNRSIPVRLNLLPGQMVELPPLQVKNVRINMPETERWLCSLETADGRKAEKYFTKTKLHDVYQNGAEIKIDGNLSDWKTPPGVSMMDRSRLEPSDPHIPWKDTNDLGAQAYMSWDDEYLYLAAEVNDDAHFNNSPAALYNGDSWQLAFDPDNNGVADINLRDHKGYSSDDVEFTVALLKSGAAITRTCGCVPGAKDLAITRDDKNGKTFYEMRMPLKDLKLEPGKAFGFNMVFFDDDHGSGQEYRFELAPGITGDKNPAVFPKFILREQSLKP